VEIDISVILSSVIKGESRVSKAREESVYQTCVVTTYFLAIKSNSTALSPKRVESDPWRQY